MATIDKKYIPSYNLFINQNKQLKDKITPQEWNSLWNILATQADHTTEHLKLIHDFITGGGEVSETIELHPEATSLLDYIKNHASSKIHIGPSEPENVIQNMLWIDTSEED